MSLALILSILPSIVSKERATLSRTLLKSDSESDGGDDDDLGNSMEEKTRFWFAVFGDRCHQGLLILNLSRKKQL
jgi:hypothetical protein